MPACGSASFARPVMTFLLGATACDLARWED